MRKQARNRPDSAIASRVQHALSLSGACDRSEALDAGQTTGAIARTCSYALGERTITRECARSIEPERLMSLASRPLGARP